MSPSRLRLVLLGALAGSGLVFFIIVFVGLGILSAKNQKLIELKVRSRTVDAQSLNLAAAKKQVAQYSYFNDVAKTVLPSDKDQAQAVFDIISLADQSGISIASITFPASSLGAKAATASGNDAATAPPASAISQAKPVEGIKGLYFLELTISPQIGPSVPEARRVTYPKLLDFLGRIEHNRRTAQITQVNIQLQASDQAINFTMIINIFIKP